MNFFETKLAFVLTPLTFTVSYLLSFDYFLLSDYKFYFSNIVAIVSIALGFLTTIIFQLWSFNNSPLLSVFREYNLIRNLNLYELTSVISSIIMIILSIIVPLYFSSYIYLGGSKVITAIFNSLLVYMIYCFIRLSYLFFIINNKLIRMKEKLNIKNLILLIKNKGVILYFLRPYEHTFNFPIYKCYNYPINIQNGWWN